MLKPLCLLCGENSEKWARDPPSVVFPRENVCWHCAPEETLKINFLLPGGTFGPFWAPFGGTLLGEKRPQGRDQKWAEKKNESFQVPEASTIIAGVTLGPKWSLGGRGVNN